MIGPFETKHVLIIGLLIGVLTGVMYFLKDFLRIPLIIPLWLIITVLGDIIFIIVLLVLAIVGYYRFGKEGFIFAYCRKNGIPVLMDVELGSENGEMLPGDKINPKDVTFKDNIGGVKVDPSILSADARPIRLPGGLDIYIFGGGHWMPQSVTNSLAFKTMMKYRKEHAQDLSFLTDKEFVELIRDPENYLEINAETKLNKYFKVAPKHKEDGTIDIDTNGNPIMTHVRQYQVDGKWFEMDMDLTTMIHKITQARNDISKLPVEGGFITGIEAFVHNSVAYSSQHLAHLRMLDKEKMRNELHDAIERLKLVPIILAICGGITVILAIIFVLGSGACKP